MLTATDSIGQDSTLGTRGWYADEHLDAYLIAPVCSLLVLLLDTGTDADGVGDLVTVAELGPEAVARAAVELPPLPTAAPTVIGAEPGSGDLATVTDLGPKAVERARTGITDANQGLPMPPVALPTA